MLWTYRTCSLTLVMVAARRGGVAPGASPAEAAWTHARQCFANQRRCWRDLGWTSELMDWPLLRRMAVSPSQDKCASRSDSWLLCCVKVKSAAVTIGQRPQPPLFKISPALLGCIRVFASRTPCAALQCCPVSAPQSALKLIRAPRVRLPHADTEHGWPSTVSSFTYA